MQNRNQAIKYGALVPLLAGAGSAMAAVPAIVGTTVTDMTADATSIFGLVFPFAAAVIGMTIVFKLFKRFVNKA